jgi:hypothetical protein
MKASSVSRLVLAGIIIVGCLWFVAGDDQNKPPKPDSADEPSVPVHPWPSPEPVDLTSLDGLTEKTLSLTKAQKFPDCHLIFEPDGAIAQRFPLDDPARRARTLAGCQTEAYRVTDDGTRYVAYAVPADGPGWDLRLASYAESGQLSWHYRLDRSRNAKNFTANFRRSFIAPMLPRLVCTGTLWAGGTQTACVDANSGEEKWAGILKFWAGIAPQPLEHALNTATLSGLTRRYPFSGVEMRSHPFDGDGGRAAYYATDGQRLFFVPSPSSTAPSGANMSGANMSGANKSGTNKPSTIAMTAFDLARFEPVWRLELPSRPSPTWEYASAELGVVVFKIAQTMYAADNDTGEILWAATIGADEPPIAARGGKLYILTRRKTSPNLIFEIEPTSGDINWYAKAPTGTLEIEVIADTLILRSVRAVQEVSDLE